MRAKWALDCAGRANATVGYYRAPDVKSRILCIRSWQPGLQPGSRPK
jgi:hypothetical protein